MLRHVQSKNNSDVKKTISEPQFIEPIRGFCSAAKDNSGFDLVGEEQKHQVVCENPYRTFSLSIRNEKAFI